MILLQGYVIIKVISAIRVGHIMLEVLSYGGGVQSTAICLLIFENRLPKPDWIVFSDTGSERPETYETVKQISLLAGLNDVPFAIVSAKDKLHEGYQARESLPMVGISICTHKYKIRPIRRFIRAELKTNGIHNNGVLGKKPWANVWLGISTDERKRVRESDRKYISNKFPLIEMNWSRNDCISYLKNFPELKVEKSGCFMCMYQTAAGWNDLKRKHPDLFDIALELEKVGMEGKNKLKGLFRSSESIEKFNHTHTLGDFGFDLEGMDHCESGGGCFL